MPSWLLLSNLSLLDKIRRWQRFGRPPSFPLEFLLKHETLPSGPGQRRGAQPCPGSQGFVTGHPAMEYKKQGGLAPHHGPPPARACEPVRGDPHTLKPGVRAMREHPPAGWGAVPDQSWAVRNSSEATPSLTARREHSLTPPTTRGPEPPARGPGPLLQGHKRTPGGKGSLRSDTFTETPPEEEPQRGQRRAGCVWAPWARERAGRGTRVTSGPPTGLWSKP